MASKNTSTKLRDTIKRRYALNAVSVLKKENHSIGIKAIESTYAHRLPINYRFRIFLPNKNEIKKS